MRSPSPVADPAAQPTQTARVANIANGLTLLRLMLVPVFLALLLVDAGHSPGWRVWAFVAFVVASVTDLIDGDLARSRGLVTDVGKVADPIADKALTSAAFSVAARSQEPMRVRSVTAQVPRQITNDTPITHMR